MGRCNLFSQSQAIRALHKETAMNTSEVVALTVECTSSVDRDGVEGEVRKYCSEN